MLFESIIYLFDSNNSNSNKYIYLNQINFFFSAENSRAPFFIRFLIENLCSLYTLKFLLWLFLWFLWLLRTAVRSYNPWFFNSLPDYPVQKRDGLEIVTSNDCDWSMWNGHVKFDWPKIQRAKRALTLLVN